MKRTRVRFNLGAGKNYMKWKVEYPDGKVEYLHPTDVQLVMTGCKMKNHRKTAQKIFDGGTKTVCAWVLCESIQIRKEGFDLDNENRIRYNPRVQPNWTLNGRVVDGEEFDKIISVDYGLYVQQFQPLPVLT
jgi:hypothetical protein